ncbi:5-formyltetrahydrofolate cyclo-ligase [Deinococcota bacterium DY0809b]
MKRALRKRYLERRVGLETDRLSERAVAGLAGFLRDRGAQRVMIYLPFRGELSPLGLVERLPGALFYLPRTAAAGLTVHPLEAPREQHRYGFEQPAPEAPVIEPALLDAVVVPGIAFDRTGGRLGYGAGYYDRFLAALPPRILRIGLVPEALVLDALPHDPWDVPVDFLATERGVRPALRDHGPDKMAP